MTPGPDDPNDPADGGGRGRDEGARRKLDEDAVWRDIVAHYGEEPAVEDLLAADDPPRQDSTDDGGTPDPQRPVPGSDERLRGLFRPAWDDPVESEATWEDEGHFVPPTPPPARVQDPRRGIAWLGLFGSPFCMLLAVVLGLTLPHWLLFLLAVGFTGGFVYLVATMPNRRGGPGDDGAVL